MLSADESFDFLTASLSGEFGRIRFGIVAASTRDRILFDACTSNVSSTNECCYHAYLVCLK